MYDSQNERLFLLNKVLYKCVSCHYKTLLSLGNCEVEQDNLVLDTHPQATYFKRGEGLYFTFTFNHLADAFIQSDLQMRIVETIGSTRQQQRYTSAMTSLS